MAGNALNSLARVLFRNVLRTHVLSYRDLRLLGVAGAFDSIGFMGEAIVLGWIVLQLTGSPFMVGAALARGWPRRSSWEFPQGPSPHG